jgi:hypothetical protein
MLLESARTGEDVSWLDGQSVCAALDAILGEGSVSVGFDEKASAVTFAPADRVRVERALDDLRRRAPGPIALRVSLDRLAEGRDGETLLAAEGHADPARTWVLAEAVERSVTSDFDVEIAQASSIGDPVLSILRTGVSAAICLTPMPDGASAVVEAVARSSRLLDDEPIALGHDGLGRADRCAVAFDELGACFRVENGRASEVTWTGRDGARMRLRVEARWKAPPAAGDPAVVVSPLFRSHFAGFRSVPAPAPRTETDASWRSLDTRSTSLAELADIAFSEPVYLVSVKGGEGVAVLPAGESRTAAQQFQRLQSAADGLLRQSDVRCVALNVPAGAQASLDGALPEGAFVVASYEGPVLRGLPATATGGTDRRYLADWDVEVAQSARIPDPLLEPLGTGHLMNFTVHEDAFDLDLDLSRLDRVDRQEMRLAVGRAALGVQGDKGAAPNGDPGLPEETVAVEKPVVAGVRVVESIPLGPDGTGSLRRSGGALLGRGRELVVLVRAR